jgi:ribosome-interacting GTPase 1
MIIDKEGAAQIAVIGEANAGKSQLVTQITNASSPVADYAFTTYAPIPGMMEFENIQIQLIDMPPLAAHATESWFSPILLRADALLILVDLSIEPLLQMTTITNHLEEMRFTIDQDKVEDNQGFPLRYKKAMIIGNKMDMDTADQGYTALVNRYREHLPVISISAKNGTNLEELKLRIYQMLDILRVYTKTPGQKPDYNDPIILPRGSTLEDAAAQVHKDFRTRLKYARLWGSGKHDGIMVKREHVLQDGDIIELHI